jgi:5-methylthioadenosine/S-adenosylhomocysteine deaminase
MPEGWVAIDGGRIVAVGSTNDVPPATPRHLGRVAILPGLVNAHTHLELSWLRGRVPPAATFIDWIKQLFAMRGARAERPDDERVLDAARAAVGELRECGTSAVGDISNSLASVQPIRAGGLRGVVFHELLGFAAVSDKPVVDSRSHRASSAALGGEAVRVSVAPHAPYSVSAELFRAIRREVSESPVPITAIHVAESESEIAFLADGSGPWPSILRWVGAAREGWQPPGLAPVPYLDSLGVLDARTMVVHGVNLKEAELKRLADIGCTLVTCPRSNQWVGVGVPPVQRFYDSGLKVAVGTDSLASVENLNLFSELKAMRWLAAGVPARRLLESATRVGAEALGLGHELGTIDAGKRAELIAVDLGRAENAADDVAVEEHLVGGIEPYQVRWVTP